MSILDKARDAVHRTRQEKYGPPERNLRTIGELWGIVLQMEPINPRTVALMMICVKISRELKEPDEDNLVDIAGYAEAGHLASSPLPSATTSAPTSTFVPAPESMPMNPSPSPSPSTHATHTVPTPSPDPAITVVCSMCGKILSDFGVKYRETYTLCKPCFDDMEARR